MEKFILDNFFKIKKKDMEFKFMKTKINIKDNGIIT